MIKQVNKMRIFKRVLKIILGVLILAVVAGIVYVLIHLNAIMLAFGKGSLKLKDYAQTEKALKSSAVYTVTDSTAADGTKTFKCVSNDKAVTMQVTDKNGAETITGTVDKSNLPAVDKSDINSIKKTAETYLSPFLTEDQIIGLGGYAVKEKLTGSSGGINISHTYDGATVDVSTDSSGNINFTITKSK
jgi:hypothetical protein